jgi:hypothetical protein
VHLVGFSTETNETVFPSCMLWHFQGATIRESYVDTSCASELVQQIKHRFTPVSVKTQLPFILTYFLTTWSRVLVEKLTDSQSVKKFPTRYGTRRFNTASTSARHVSPS